jgi:lysozyme
VSQTYTAPPKNRVSPAAGGAAAALALACALIAGREGEVRHTYVDKLGRGQPLTACYGETSGIVAGKTYTHAECMAMLARSAEAHAAEVAKCLPAGLPDPTAAAFYDIGYNMGAPAFCRTAIYRRKGSHGKPTTVTWLARARRWGPTSSRTARTAASPPTAAVGS